MLLFIGLGNPGRQYENTRHNVGFMVVDAISDHHNFLAEKSKFNAVYKEGKIAGKKVVLFKPTTYMNKSGIAVSEIKKFYKIPLENIYVFYDDLDLAFSKVKTKIGGGSGGHNGIKSLDQFIGKNYKRIRIGIDHPGHKDQVSDYVLKNFKSDERIVIDQLCDKIAQNIETLLQGNDPVFIEKLTK